MSKLIKIKYTDCDFYQLIEKRHFNSYDEDCRLVSESPRFTTKDDLELLTNYISDELENANHHGSTGIPEQIADLILKHSNNDYKLACKVLKDIAEGNCLMD